MHRFVFLTPWTLGLAVAALTGCPSSPGLTTDSGASIDAPVVPDARAALDAPAVSDAPGLDAPSPIDAPIAVADTPTSATVTLRDVSVYGSCKPVIPPDPVIAFWNVDIAGATGTSATLESATLIVTGASSTTQTLVVDVTTISLSGGSGTAAMRKTSGTPAIDGCGELCGGGTFRLDLIFRIDGAAIPASATGAYGCAF